MIPGIAHFPEHAMIRLFFKERRCSIVLINHTSLICLWAMGHDEHRHEAALIFFLGGECCTWVMCWFYNSSVDFHINFHSGRAASIFTNSTGSLLRPCTVPSVYCFLYSWWQLLRLGWAVSLMGAVVHSVMEKDFERAFFFPHVISSIDASFHNCLFILFIHLLIG